ncbi:Cof-type HAD-IIB family hydrolase [Parabacteroides sp. FAFU027]|uniref:Cof-type HAD-IIB family hydrolase n=1 Tax=Parabacteroides sp. FAFU027 TaxID=2922715 RepID=UPI001FAF4F81|nr:Cof-type HAD-IIB family hydrolase [Parabacteroides sp. FAFU027]
MSTTTSSTDLNYKMLVLDLDDTLLRDDHSISERNRKMLLKAQEKGVKVVLASGRPTPAMTQYIETLQLDKYDSYLISFNGGMVTSIRDNEVIFEQSLTKEEIHSLHDFCKVNDLHIITYSDKGVISETESEYIDVEIKLTGLPHHKVPCFKSEVQTSAVKCILLENPDYLKTMETKLKAERTDLSIARSKPFFLEVMPQGIDKAASLELLSNMLGIQQSEVIAVGNAGNDLSMVEYAGLGVWVDNVTPELRDKADVIVASNMEDGVAEVVERFILGEN